MNLLIRWDPPGFGSDTEITHDGRTNPKIVFAKRITGSVYSLLHFS